MREYLSPYEEVLRELDSSAEGLSSREAAERHEYWMAKFAEWYGRREADCFFNPTSVPLTRYRKDAGLCRMVADEGRDV